MPCRLEQKYDLNQRGAQSTTSGSELIRPPFVLVLSSTPKGCSIEEIKSVFAPFGTLHGEGIGVSTNPKKNSHITISYDSAQGALKAYKALNGTRCLELDPTRHLSLSYSRVTRLKLIAMGLLDESASTKWVTPVRMPPGPVSKSSMNVIGNRVDNKCAAGQHLKPSAQRTLRTQELPPAQSKLKKPFCTIEQRARALKQLERYQVSRPLETNVDKTKALMGTPHSLIQETQPSRGVESYLHSRVTEEQSTTLVSTLKQTLIQETTCRENQTTLMPMKPKNHFRSLLKNCSLHTKLPIPPPTPYDPPLGPILEENIRGSRTNSQELLSSHTFLNASQSHGTTTTAPLRNDGVDAHRDTFVADHLKKHSAHCETDGPPSKETPTDTTEDNLTRYTEADQCNHEVLFTRNTIKSQPEVRSRTTGKEELDKTKENNAAQNPYLSTQKECITHNIVVVDEPRKIDCNDLTDMEQKAKPLSQNTAEPNKSFTTSLSANASFHEASDVTQGETDMASAPINNAGCAPSIKATGGQRRAHSARDVMQSKKQKTTLDSVVSLIEGDGHASHADDPRSTQEQHLCLMEVPSSMTVSHLVKAREHVSMDSGIFHILPTPQKYQFCIEPSIAEDCWCYPFVAPVCDIPICFPLLTS